MSEPADEHPMWRKSTYCADNTCVEVKDLGDKVLLRDSKNPEAQCLTFERTEWKEFLVEIASHEKLW